MMRSARTMLLAAGLLTATGLAVAVWPAPAGSPKSIISLSKNGANEEALLREVRQSSASYEVSPDEIIRMKEANVPDTVIVEMLEKRGAHEREQPAAKTTKD